MWMPSPDWGLACECCLGEALPLPCRQMPQGTGQQGVVVGWLEDEDEQRSVVAVGHPDCGS